MNQIFISLFTSQKERPMFFISLFTSWTFNIHSRRTLTWRHLTNSFELHFDRTSLLIQQQSQWLWNSAWEGQIYNSFLPISSPLSQTLTFWPNSTAQGKPHVLAGLMDWSEPILASSTGSIMNMFSTRTLRWWKAIMGLWNEQGLTDRGSEFPISNPCQTIY